MRRFLFVLLAVNVAVAFNAAAAKPKKAPTAKKATPKKEVPAVKLNNAEASAPPAGEQVPISTRGPTRIDFDDRLIQGQTNKSGAVYLYDRKELKTRSMVKKKESFRDEIVGSLYDT